MFSHYSSRTGPIGSNMSGSGYPFRGIYKVDDSLNHGHSGQQLLPHKPRRAQPTALDVYITGSNLAIRKLHTSDGARVQNDLAIDQSAPRAVALEVNNPRMTALAVPNDGHEYKLTTTVRHDTSKHVCRMTLRGESAVRPDSVAPLTDTGMHRAVWLLGAPVGHDAGETEQLRRVLQIVADDKQVDSVDGQYAIPVSVQNCRIELNKELLCQWLSQPQQQPLGHTSAAASSCPLWCPSTAQSIPIPSHDDRVNNAPADPRQHSSSDFQSPQSQPPPLMLETRVTSAHPGGPAEPIYFTTRCTGYEVELMCMNSNTVARAMDFASIAISTKPAFVESPPHTEQSSHATDAVHTSNKRKTWSAHDGGVAEIRVVVRHPSTHGVVLQQTQHVPTVSPSRDAPDVASAVAAPQPTIPASLPTVGASGYGDGYAWVESLGAALQASSIEEARERVQLIGTDPAPRVTDAHGRCIVNFVKEQLNRAPPALSMLVNQIDANVSEVHCPGYAVRVLPMGNACTTTAAVDADAKALVCSSAPLSASVGATHTAGTESTTGTRITVVTNSPSPRPIASCTLRFVPRGDGLCSRTAAASAETQNTALVQRLVECLQQHHMDPIRVGDALDGQRSAGPVTSAGLHLLTLLQTTLRRCTAASQQRQQQSPASAAAMDGIQFVCGNGVLQNIHTVPSHLILSAHVDDAFLSGTNSSSISSNSADVCCARSLAQHGRLPATGTWPARTTPYHITLLATDPHTQAVAYRTHVTILGAEQSLPVQCNDGRSSRSHDVPVGLSPPQSQASPLAVYLDVCLQRIDDTCFVRLLTRPELRIVCVVDGRGGDTGRCEHLTKLSPQLSHHLELSVRNEQGYVLFQQKLDVPPMSAAVVQSTASQLLDREESVMRATKCATAEPLVWGLALQDGGLAIDPDVASVSITQLSVDRGPEVVLQDSLARLDTSTSRHVIIHRYRSSSTAENNVHGSSSRENCSHSASRLIVGSRPSQVNGSDMIRVGTVRLRLPGFVGVHVIGEIATLLVEVSDAPERKEHIRSRLKELRREYDGVSVLRELVTAALGLMRHSPSCETTRRQSPAPSMSSQREHSSSGGSRVYFRLTGTD